MLAILLMRQAVLCLLSDMQGLKSAHEDKSSAFDIEQLGRPRELLDLLKLAYHSSGGGASDGSMAFSRLWAMLEGLVKNGDDAQALPGPFKALPLLLRDDALGHLKREKNGIATLQSPHPLQGTRMLSKHSLTVDGAAHLVVMIDRRSELTGSAQILLTLDEAGNEVVTQTHPSQTQTRPSQPHVGPLSPSLTPCGALKQSPLQQNSTKRSRCSGNTFVPQRVTLD